MRRLFLIILAVVLPAVAQAQYSGLSAYAARAPSFPCDKFLNIALRAENPAMSVTWEGFGEDDACIVRFLDTLKDQPHLIQIHPWLNTAVRSRTTEPGMIFYGLSKSHLNKLLEERDPGLILALQLRLAEIVNFVNAHGNANTQCLISTGLEDDYTPKAFATMAEVVKNLWPYLIVRNPVGGRGSTQGQVWFLERHGDTARADVVNEDGAIDSLRKSKKFLDRNPRALARFLWQPDHQGRTKSGRPVYPRAARDFVISDRDERELGDLLSNY